MYGPRVPPPYPSLTAPPCDPARGREHKRTIPVDGFQDLLKYPGLYAELYPDILPLTRHLHRQALEQISRAEPGAAMKRTAENVLPHGLTRTPDGWYVTIANSEQSGQTEAGRGVGDPHSALYDAQQLDVQTVRTSPGTSRASSSSSGGEGLRRMEDVQAQDGNSELSHALDTPDAYHGARKSQAKSGYAEEVIFDKLVVEPELGSAASQSSTLLTSAVLDEVERGEGCWGVDTMLSPVEWSVGTIYQST